MITAICSEPSEIPDVIRALKEELGGGTEWAVIFEGRVCYRHATVNKS